MAWSWSHSQEAYRDAEINLNHLPQDTIATIWAEWQASTPGEFGDYNFNSRKYNREIRRAHSHIRRGLIGEMIVQIWVKASEYSTCDNGGWNAWLCPYGCGCHTVPFHIEEEE